MRWLRIAALLVVFGFLVGAAVWTRPFGEPHATGMDDHFIEHSQEEAAANNTVTAVLFDYRGFDTLGEATVLFGAVIGVALLLRRWAR
ncbi:MAG: hydrogen gas-evolving membrane-bound hydrogenase subunit E [Candidatus Bipolaricaulota bacterium]